MSTVKTVTKAAKAGEKVGQKIVSRVKKELDKIILPEGPRFYHLIPQFDMIPAPYNSVTPTFTMWDVKEVGLA